MRAKLVHFDGTDGPPEPSPSGLRYRRSHDIRHCEAQTTTGLEMTLPEKVLHDATATDGYVLGRNA